MKPISLKIKGLNSFKEEQTIDFLKLTSRGLFGIFGPTGSGKSSILDGITLALYGKVARKSSNYININCDSMAVSFEFQISGAEIKRYIVDREFKRDKKSGNPVSGKCKVIDITGETPVILADKVNEVNSVCEAILGLGLEDFTRTVVLPQGKFSEFLKLEGKSRRDMLERLFNLQQYGDNLAFKLKKEINREESENSELIGALSGYEDVSETSLKEKEDEFKIIESVLKEEESDLKKIENEYKEKEELWNLSKELQCQEDKKAQLELKKDEIEKTKKVFLNGIAAEKIMPYVEAYEGTKKFLATSRENLIKLEEKYNMLNTKKNDITGYWNQWRSKKDERIPVLRVKEQQLKNAIEEEYQILLLEKELQDINQFLDVQGKNQSNLNDKLAGIVERLENGKKVTEATELELEGLKVDSELKVLVQKGLLLTSKVDDIKLSIVKNNNKIKNIDENLRKNSEIRVELDNELKEKREKLEELKTTLKRVLENCPGTQEDLLKIQSQYNQGVESWKRYKECLDEIEEFDKKLIEFAKSQKKITISKEDIAKEIQKKKEKIRLCEMESMAQSLRESLSLGKPCPVCGSLDHHREGIPQAINVDLSDLRLDMEKSENNLRLIERDEATVEANIKMIKVNKTKKENEIKLLGEDFKKKSIEELEKKVNDFNNKLNEYNKEKEKLEEHFNKTKEETLSLEGKVNITNSLMETEKKQREEVTVELEKEEKEFADYKSEISMIQEKSGVVDFNEKDREIQNIEKQKNVVELKLKKCRKLLDELNRSKEDIQLQLNEVKENLAKQNSSKDEKEKIKLEKKNNLVKLFGDNLDFSSELNKVSNEIKEIEETYLKYNEAKEVIEAEYKKCNDDLIGEIATERELKTKNESEDINIKKLLLEEKLDSIETVKKFYLNKSELTRIKVDIEEYEHEVTKILGTIENIIKKINNRQISEEDWNHIKLIKEEKELKINEIKEKNIKLKSEIDLFKIRLLELKDLLVKKEKLDHKLALLSDLEKLFKGKKFVEFVASHRLKYISIEASKQLKEISSGTYGLEVDESGRFIIRDYKNGGAARDASTLSGGETFLTSLALALALSNEIQLKGTAPLELFFLDEGFGTLDDNLLEIVMSSLERIHSERLKIGIISHVEAIKNRVPVKLIVSPAEAGKGGSKVKIERS